MCTGGDPDLLFSVLEAGLEEGFKLPKALGLGMLPLTSDVDVVFLFVEAAAVSVMAALPVNDTVNAFEHTS